MALDAAATQRSGAVLLDIGEDTGALVVHTGSVLLGREIEVSPITNAARRTHTDVLERRVGAGSVFAAVFPELAAGEYSLWRDVLTDERVSVPAGAVAEVDWRNVADAAAFRRARPEGQAAARRPDDSARAAALGLLPARYLAGTPVSAAPMGSAPMVFDEQGGVAWDEMWTNYCDLALAGGPKHRDTLLEPTSPADVLARADEYEHVVTEIERGLRLVTGLRTVTSACPGWVGLECDGEDMARWLLCAIAVENVSVRRDGRLLYLPAAPSYRLDKEIKNVVTVVAKTFHYWNEHRED